MNRKDLRQMCSEILRSDNSSAENYDVLAHGVVEVYRSKDDNFRQHIKDRARRVTETTGQEFDADNFDIEMARAFIADEIGFTGWEELIQAVNDPERRKYPILFHYAMAALWRGGFTALEQTLGGPDVFDDGGAACGGSADFAVVFPERHLFHCGQGACAGHAGSAPEGVRARPRS